MSLKIEMMVSRNQVGRRPSVEEIEGGLQVLTTSKFLSLFHYTYLPPQQGALHISREILEEITWEIPQLEASDVEGPSISFEMKEHLFIIWILVADNNSPLRLQIHQGPPTNKEWVLQIDRYNEGVQDEFDPVVCSFQNDRHHYTSQRTRTLGIHDVNRLARIAFIESWSMSGWDGVVEFLMSVLENETE